MWNSVQCAIQGRSHVKTGIPCQDKTFCLNENGVYVIALADGAGSAKMSHYGAEVVSKKICHILASKFEAFYNESDGVAIKRVIIGDLIKELEIFSENQECEIKELASTLLSVAVRNGKYIIVHIGDGVIGYVKNNELRIASFPENGEFINTTIFVTSKDALGTMKLMKGELKGITGFVLMSDGTEISLYDKRNKTLVPVLKKLMDLSQKIDCKYLQSEIEKGFQNVIKKTMDDCSLIMLVEEDYLFKGYNHLTMSEKKIMFEMKNQKNCGKRIKRYDEILEYASSPKNILQISKKVHLKPKYCVRHINLLLEKNLLVRDGKLVNTAIIMDK